MQKVNRLVVALIIVISMVFAGNAFALNATDHVSVAPNGKGDVLIFPAYFTGGGWETKFVVTNTSMTESVVAKVVVRSKERTQELLDFMLFLSPADVWTGTLYIADDGRPHMMSTDDSCLSDVNTFASESAPFDAALVDACSGDTNELGYVTVIEGASFALAPFQPGVSKSSILTAYNAWIAAPSAATANTAINVLAGQEEIVNSIASVEYALNATVLKNHDWDVNVALSVQSETWIAQSANNQLGEVEAALSKNELVVPYYSQDMGSVFAIVTFPTKLAGFPCSQSNWRGPYAGFPSPQYTMSAYDLMENTVNVTPSFISPVPPSQVLNFPSEVNYISVGDLPGTFDEGWLSVNLSATTTTTLREDGNNVTYTGAPLISSSMRSDNSGRAGWLYNAHTNGQVDVDNDGLLDNSTEDMNYHYWGQADN